MKLNRFILFSSAIFLFFSCGNNSNNEPIVLVNGEKWEVIESMVGYIRTMEKDVALFERSEEKDYQLLADKLSDNIGLLTSNCTMKGAAHDEMHKWLLPYIGLVKELSKAKGDADSAAVYSEIQNSFKEYNQYFK